MMQEKTKYKTTNQMQCTNLSQSLTLSNDCMGIKLIMDVFLL